MPDIITDKILQMYEKCKCGLSITINNHKRPFIGISTKDVIAEAKRWACVPKGIYSDDICEEMIVHDMVVIIQVYPDICNGHFFYCYHWDLSIAIDMTLDAIKERESELCNASR